jgi:hypothetical protein
LAAVGLLFFGFGAFGFLVGAPFADFFAFDGDLGDFAAEAAEAAVLAAAFFSAAATGFFAAFVFFSAAPAAFFFLAAAAAVAFFGDFGRLAAVADFDLAAVAFFTFAAASDALDFAAPLGAASLNEPEAPLPFVCTNVPAVTAFFKYLRMYGDTFSASTL